MYQNYNTEQPYGQNAPQGMAPEAQQWFNAVDVDGSGHINASELQSALVNGQGNNFSESVCSLMIKMFDKERKGTINVHEFAALYQYMNSWMDIFRAYDRDGSGTIEEPELSSALQQMGFRFSPDFYKIILSKTDPINHSKISVDQFIENCIQIQRYTESFRAKDVEQKGSATIGYEEFLNIVISSLP